MQCFHPRGIARLAVIAALVSTAACGDDPVAPDGPLAISIQFDALVDGAQFTCGQTYPGIGTSSTTITPVDFRFYVHDVALIDTNGSSVPVELIQDGQWQRENLVLLDFENGSGPCANGTAAMNDVVRGTVPAGEYTGVRFTLGVPEDMNHADQTTATAPLDLTALFWSWNAGYKFLRIDHTSEAQPNGWFVHLGSTGCAPSGDPTVPATSCRNQHRPTITFDAFDFETQRIEADYARLLAGSDLTGNTGPKGCMSFPNDPECTEVMPRLGLDYEGTPTGGQTFFGIR